MNLLSASVGGVPMCHGAGGMAGHVQFGARTGGAIVILGVILFLTGAQFALGACDVPRDKGERFVLVATGAVSVWNVGIAFVVGVTAYWLNKKGLLRL
jgi:Molybdate transporter of MFS superfamily